MSTNYQKTKEYREKYRKQIADKFLRSLSDKQKDWHKSWQGKNMSPINAVTGSRYKGSNRFILYLLMQERGITDQRFATFEQIKKNNWKLAKGSKGHLVEYWFPIDKEEKKVVSWKEYEDTNDRKKYYLSSRYYYVYSAADIEGLPALPEPELKDIKVDEMIPTICKNMQIDIIHDDGDRAFYRPSEDKIHMPKVEYFESDYDYNSVALHELSHATGAPHRLNRNIANRFGSNEYAYEELVAEISSSMMSANLASTCSDYQMDNHTAYVQSWVHNIQSNPDVLIQAIADAGKAADYLEWKAELLLEHEYMQMSGEVIEVTEDTPKEIPMISHDEIKKAGYKPTTILITNFNKLNIFFGKKLSFKEVAELAKKLPEKPRTSEDRCVAAIQKECQRQELEKMSALCR